MQSKELTEFYQAYATWLDDGAPEGQVFSRKDGLCDNLYEYCTSKGMRRLWAELDAEMMEQFSAAGLHSIYPFNHGRSASYCSASNHDRHYLNPRRIAWVKAHANG